MPQLDCVHMKKDILKERGDNGNSECRAVE